MHGNVWEWCEDKKGLHPIFRGGCWSNHAADCRAAYRSTNVPTDRSDFCGFRVALSPSVQSPVAKQAR